MALPLHVEWTNQVQKRVGKKIAAVAAATGELNTAVCIAKLEIR